MTRDIDTGYRIREGSRILTERFTQDRLETLEQKLKVVRSSLVVLAKDIEKELEAA